ncbi:MAG: nitronate monooxygenase [Bacteroidetes bacterium]|uniref:Nitronate monooxygenase n=1 Tax=Candidatus Pullibacteroides excrementavium TaxID=2840905 RepID=A0A9D9DWV0_9BACT|nr:nitronate monooxygenase [Candidatus Pullibacteroides excrementavium]
MPTQIPSGHKENSYQAIDSHTQQNNPGTKNRICQLFGIRYPVISGGMVWCSGWRLASAVSENGGLGLIGAGSMHPETLREHIRKCKEATEKPFGVNVPLMYPELETIANIIVEEKVPIVFTSAGNPKAWTPFFHEHGIKVAHVVASTKFARKCEEAGVDAIVAEGFEAGGHNGKEETTTMCLIPEVRRCTTLPLIAAGGIGSGAAMLASMGLGAEGVQIGTRFALTEESSASPAFKEFCTRLNEGDTLLLLKKVGPTRLARNRFFEQVQEAEDRGAGKEEIAALLGRGRAKKGIFEGDLENGELEIGQNVSQFKSILPVKTVMEELVSEYNRLLASLRPM